MAWVAAKAGRAMMEGRTIVGLAKALAMGRTKREAFMAALRGMGLAGFERGANWGSQGSNVKARVAARTMDVRSGVFVTGGDGG